MALEPIARGALGAADLGVGHLLGDLAPQAGGIGVPAHGGDVEPLVRLDQIDRDACAGRIDQAQRKAAFRVFRLDGDVAAAMSMSAISASPLSRLRLQPLDPTRPCCPANSRPSEGDLTGENLNDSLIVAMN